MVGGECLLAASDVRCTPSALVPHILRSYCLQGVILYIMVTGFPPYDIPTREDERFDIICNGDLMRQLEAWESKFTCGCARLSCCLTDYHHTAFSSVYLSQEVTELLQWMLTENPKDRPTLAQVMSHEWVMSGEVLPPHLQH